MGRAFGVDPLTILEEWSPARLGLALDALDAEAEEARRTVEEVGAMSNRPDIVYTLPLAPG